jgi:pimeloyl-ACP methyl ester carboxylesterase
MEAGEGPPLVHLHGAGGMRLNAAHDLLSRQFRVIAFEMPGFGTVENAQTQTMPDLASTMAAAVEALGLRHINLMGTSFGGKVALWLAVQRPELIGAVVLEAPAAIRPEGSRPASGTPAEIARMLYAHPERMPPIPAPEPDRVKQIAKFVRRLAGPDRDAPLEGRIRQIQLPLLVVFGTRDGMIPPTMGRIYKELIPDAHLVFVYDAAHAIAAERPEAFVEVVADFLERHDAFVISRTETVILR